MMKFFRKYNKHLLAVFMTLLLVVWLGGTALTAWLAPTPGSEVIARAFGREIQGYDRALAADETRILDAIGLFHWRTLHQGDAELQPLDWYLLRREAEQMGIQIPSAQIDDFLFKRLQITNERLAQIRQGRARGVSIEQIRAAIAGYLMVQEAAQTAATSVVRVTEARVKHLARDTLEKIRVEFLVLPATSFRDNNETLDEAELAAHFETYKDVAPRSQGGLGFGYQIPTQVRVQYIEADLAKIKPTIAVSEDEIVRYYEENRAEFVKPATPPPSPAPTPTVPPTITPAAPTTRPIGSRRRRAATTQPAAAPTPAVNMPATPTPSPEPDPKPEAEPQAATPTTSDPGTAVKAEIVFAQDVEAASPETTGPATTAPSPTVAPAATQPATTITVGPSPSPTLATAPAAAPAAPAAPPTPTIEYLPLSEVRDQILDKIRTPLAAEKAETFMKGVLGDLSGFWDGAERDEEGFRIAPSAEIAEPDHYQNVLNKRRRRGWRVAEACSVVTSELIDATLTGATRVEALRMTNPADPRVQTGGFNRLLMLVKGVGTFPAEDSTEDTSTYIAVNQTCPVLLKSSNSNNYYVFRVTEVVPAHPPEDMEAIRLRVDSDLRTAKSFAGVEQEAQRIADIARREGLEAARSALSEDVQPRVEVVRPEPFARLRQRSASFGRTSRFVETPSRVDRIFGTQESTRAFIDACFALGREAADPSSEYRVAVIPRPAQRQVVVVRWVETLGMRRDEYQAERGRLIPQLAYMDQQEIRRKWFGPEEIQKRVGFELVGVTDDDENVEP